MTERSKLNCYVLFLINKNMTIFRYVYSFQRGRLIEEKKVKYLSIDLITNGQKCIKIVFLTICLFVIFGNYYFTNYVLRLINKSNVLQKLISFSKSTDAHTHTHSDDTSVQ